VLVRTDIRGTAGSAGALNAMLTQASTIRVDLPAASPTDSIAAIVEALAELEAGLAR
jgi:hypothetical protein